MCRAWFEKMGPIPYFGDTSLGPIQPRHVVLNHYDQHVKKCKTCQEGLELCRKIEKGLMGAGEGGLGAEGTGMVNRCVSSSGGAGGEHVSKGRGEGKQKIGAGEKGRRGGKHVSAGEGGRKGGKHMCGEGGRRGGNHRVSRGWGRGIGITGIESVVEYRKGC